MSIPDEKLARWTALPRQFSSPERRWHHGVNDRAYLDHEPYLTVCADDARESVVAFLPHTSDLDALAIAALPEMREAIDELVAEVRRLRVSMGMALDAAESDMPGTAAATLRAGLRGAP